MYVSGILQPFSESITKEENTYAHFMQDDGAIILSTYIINILTKVFEDRQISHKLWPFRSPGLGDSYLCGNLEDKMYSNNPHILDETITTLCAKQYFLEIQSLLREEEIHFDYVLW